MAKLIKYFNKELHGEKLVLIPLEYPCKNSEYDYWLDIIRRSYGQHGEVTSIDIQDEKTKEEIEAQAFSQLVIENKKKDVLISRLAQQINTLNIKINQLGGSK